MAKDSVEKLLWSIALPGFGQMLNGHLVKGIFFVFLEILINWKANLNEIIIDSFLGGTQKAILETNYHWLMFYPCVYLYAIWDAYRFASRMQKPYSFLPFVLSAFIGTIGVIYSKIISVMGVLLGPVFTTIMFLVCGFFLGKIAQVILIRKELQKQEAQR